MAPRLRAARRLRGADRHPRRTHRRTAGRVDRRGASTRCPALKDKAERNGYHALRDRHGRRGVPPGPRPRPRRAGRADGARRVDHLHLDDEPRAGHRRRRAAVHGCCRGARVTGVRPRRRTTPRCAPRAATSAAAGSSTRPDSGADHLDAEFGYHRFTVTPRRGELLVFDKLTRPMVPCIVLAVPSSRGKGVLVSPTIYGNVMVGPTSENLEDRTATGTSEEGFEFLLTKGRALMPTLFDEEITATYAGLRAATEHDDYLIDVDARAALRPRRRHPLHRADVGDGDRRTRDGPAGRRGPRRHARARIFPRRRGCRTSARPSPGPYQDDERIAADPEYGRIVCFCERVTRRRDPRRIPLAHSAGRPRRAASSHPGDERTLPRLLLRRDTPGRCCDAAVKPDDRPACRRRDRRRRTVRADSRRRAGPAGRRRRPRHRTRSRDRRNPPPQ